MQQAVQEAVMRQCPSFAVVRPPGHHCTRTRPQGFCFLSSVAAAARQALKQHPDRVKRVLIVDWDVHHGNGSADVLEDEPNVLFVSLHRYEGGAFYPGTGPIADTGGEGNRGRHINIAWPCARLGDDAYHAAFEHVLLPVAREWNPDLVIVSAGFDAADGDPIGEMTVSPGM